MPVFTPHLDVLPAAQRHLWPELAPVSRLGFALYGGTAIALRLGHRASVDFDFFSDSPLDKEAVRAALAFVARSTVLQDRPDTLTVLTEARASDAKHVNVSFFGAITFGRVGEPETTDDGVVQVASLIDLMATKLKVLLQRVEAKDYIDIAALLGAGVGLDSGLAGASTLFGEAFQPSECLKALVYFKGGDLDTLSQGTRETLIKAVRAVGAVSTMPIIARSLTVS